MYQAVSALLNSIRIPDILSVPRPSLAAMLLGHILSIIKPRIPLRVLAQGAAAFLGDLVGEYTPPLAPLLVGLNPAARLEGEEPLVLVVGEELAVSPFWRAIFFLAS